MRQIDHILIVQTAFIGDAVLTLPLIQQTKEFFALSKIDVVAVPRAAELFKNHPAIHEVIPFDKRGSDKGVKGLFELVKRVGRRKHSLALVPHRSIRSALLTWMLRVPIRIGFSRSAGRFLFTKTVKYQPDDHEIERNLSLLSGLGIDPRAGQLPRLYPSDADARKVDKLLLELEVGNAANLIGIAPGTIWNTKRWLKERFAFLAAQLAQDRFEIVLVGGKEDVELCAEIRQLSDSKQVYDVSGKLSLLQSAELIGRCHVLISNDSAPMHFAVAMRTPVVAIFGATVPAFGFAPRGRFDVVVESRGLDCRPCTSHGGDKCPIKTFECMGNITHERVHARVMEVLEKVQTSV